MVVKENTNVFNIFSLKAYVLIVMLEVININIYIEFCFYRVLLSGEGVVFREYLILSREGWLFQLKCKYIQMIS